MLDRFRLMHFKAFDNAEFRLAPLTLVYGRNASGKSSIIEALKILGRGLQNVTDGSNAVRASRWLEHYRDVTYENHRHRHDSSTTIVFVLTSGPYEALWALPTSALTAPDPRLVFPLGQWGVREVVDNDDIFTGILADVESNSDLLRLYAADSDEPIAGEFRQPDLDLQVKHFFLGRAPRIQSGSADSAPPTPARILIFEPRATPDEIADAAERVRALAVDVELPQARTKASPAEEDDWPVHDQALISWFAIRRMMQCLLQRDALDGSLRSALAEVIDRVFRTLDEHPGQDEVDGMLDWYDECPRTYALVNRCAEIVERTYFLPSLTLSSPTRDADSDSDIFGLVLAQAMCALIDREFLRPREEWLEREAEAKWAHIGPTRALVRDGSELANVDDLDSAIVGADGAKFPHVLASHSDLVASLNEWLARFETGYTYSQQSDILRPTEPERHGQRDLRAGIRLADTRRLDEDGEPILVGFEDVGYGISQITPIIVQLTAPMGANGLVTIEQPELHIHPRLQTELADLFIEATSEKRGEQRKQLVVETHSEHILLRVQRRIREKQLSHEDVAVLYVDIDEDGASQVLDLRLNESGSFIDEWPDGFFGERLIELLSM